MQSINIGGKLISTEEPLIMGVINITPDSFYSNSRFSDLDKILEHVDTMMHQGADIIDVGAFSSRPGAESISIEEESDRLLPVVKVLSSHFSELILSIDSYRSQVLKHLVDICPCIINDITGFEKDPDILEIARSNNLPYVLMHMKGSPNYMQDNPEYNDVCFEVLDFMANKLHELKSKGVDQLIVDPGFGFGKTLVHNYQILKTLQSFKIFDKPLMVGLSRKSMIYKLFDAKPQDALNGTTAAHMVALLNGANILRVHDVKEASETIQIWKALKDSC